MRIGFFEYSTGVLMRLKVTTPTQVPKPRLQAEPASRRAMLEKMGWVRLNRGTWLKAAARGASGGREARAAKQLANQTRMMRRGQCLDEAIAIGPYGDTALPGGTPLFVQLQTHFTTCPTRITRHLTPHASRITRQLTPQWQEMEKRYCALALLTSHPCQGSPCSWEKHLAMMTRGLGLGGMPQMRSTINGASPLRRSPSPPLMLVSP
ncbi:uncharacterized protein K444DRAFT_205577 [Hyaloscypha bicolor E]|uniref:Uncharacterized protein n=1 Tax=Hyaloscypha bicolor E TaxID=1095630 RepID=A0A2J6TP18_9HELO|nr:uncharacterized protein K444DRAFT_205577 [Hyaloscypha bicolor E]PMD64771.1 hypothetical protein K444DRAFT_205577 [Hyaloscypha bicolor E]